MQLFILLKSSLKTISSNKRSFEYKRFLNSEEWTEKNSLYLIANVIQYVFFKKKEEFFMSNSLKGLNTPP